MEFVERPSYTCT